MHITMVNLTAVFTVTLIAVKLALHSIRFNEIVEILKTFGLETDRS